MNNIFSNLKGDKVIWALAGLLAIFSFLPVYSASSNLAYLHGDGSTFGFLVVHFFHLLLGFCLLFAVHKVPYHYFRGISILLLPVVVVLLVFTMIQGTTIDGAYASRWIRIPVLNVSFQSSTLAAVVLMVYVARYLSKITEKTVTFKETILPLWLPVFAILALILPANFSTTAIVFSMTLILMFLGGYPIKYLLGIVGVGVVMLALFVLTAKAFPGMMPSRVDTWTSRIETFFDGDEEQEQYQVEKAKIAIAEGGITGVGIGKSVQRNFLPQSSSDFIFAIIVEEMGLIGAFGVMLAYLFLLFRIVIVATKANTIFGKLVVMGVGLPIVFQALINMGVAVELFPVTGQTLPLVSSGGTSIWMTCVSLGIILSVSAKREEIKESENNIIEGEEENPLDILSEAI
ncbi:cell division protein FtsW [Christiangramia fulva]|uniref:Probable peptidoglycan glycosyltransferase FtsW n=1 Tax=Christiangramia fulva TaxID=2126553 RepID=A0A2R3Z1G1_9FLAO|nr:FtsW/RodA/SpoVE family cell cycle protein [Christiangramia fulva]AVR44092.1 cell division protein FtsW [Christiangramia fulva]